MSELEKALESIQLGKLPQSIEIEQDGQILSPDQVSQSRSAMLQWIMSAALVGQATKIRKLLEAKDRREFFEGRFDPRTLNATDVQQEIQTMNWVGLFIINDGLSTVYVACNTPHNPIRILAGETRTIDRRGADERIERLYYWCDNGLTTTLRVEGVY